MKRQDAGGNSGAPRVCPRITAGVRRVPWSPWLSGLLRHEPGASFVDFQVPKCGCT
jgi:hypothetical protein